MSSRARQTRPDCYYLGVPNLTLDQPSLSESVRFRTMQAHRDAESRPFIVALMRGELSLGAYTRYLAQLSYLYDALESRQRGPLDPDILDPRLDRAAAIRSDLTHLGVVDRAAEHPALSSTRAYVDHLIAIERDDLPAYLAHHYTRYLGDLSGGQAISRLVERHYGAAPEQLGYYRFEGLEAVPFKRGYRAAMDALGFGPDAAERFIDETERAFAFNSAIFDELGR